MKSANSGMFLVSDLTFESLIRSIEFQVGPVYTMLKSRSVEAGKIQNLRVVGDFQPGLVDKNPIHKNNT